jgi:hypothetical protein
MFGMPSFEQLNRRYGPWISLALGVAAVVYMRRGLGFAPIAVGVLMLAWIGAAALQRFTPASPAEGTAQSAAPRWRRMVVPAGKSIVVGLWQNVLFYLLPVWWASAVLGSWNTAFPLLLAAMALLSCFEYQWRAWVLDRPVTHAIWSAAVLFAALVPCAAVVGAPLRLSLALAAAASALAAAAAVAPRMRLPKTARWFACTGVAAAAGFLAQWSAPILPPVPVVKVTSGVGTAVEARELAGRNDLFAAGTDRVYAWFAVAVPAGYRQSVRFEWHRDGRPEGRATEVLIVGGRPDGFRTWSLRKAPAPGEWEVDLRTDSSQLIARERFVVR